MALRLVVFLCIGFVVSAHSVENSDDSQSINNVIDSVKTKQSALTSEININKKTVKKSDEKLTSTLSVFLNTDNKNVNSEDKSYSTDIRLITGYKFNENFKTSVWVEVEKDLAESYEEKLKDTKVMFNFGSYKLSEKLTFSPGSSIILPTSETSKRRDELNFGLEVINPLFVYKLRDDISLTYLPRMKANFHEYTTNRQDEMNIQYQLVSFYIATFDLTDKWYFEPGLVYVNSWNYNGKRKDDQYSSYLETGYAITKETTLIIGTLTGGAVIDVEQGSDQNVEILDENKTTLYGKYMRKF